MLNDIILGQDEMNATGTDISTVKQAASVLLNFIWSFLKNLSKTALIKNISSHWKMSFTDLTKLFKMLCQVGATGHEFSYWWRAGAVLLSVCSTNVWSYVSSGGGDNVGISSVANEYLSKVISFFTGLLSTYAAYCNDKEIERYYKYEFC